MEKRNDCLLVRTPTKGKDIRNQIPEIRDEKCFARCGRITPIIALQFHPKVGVCTNRLEKKNKVFVGEDTNKGERGKISEIRFQR
jgi:hypothetical protein